MAMDSSEVLGNNHARELFSIEVDRLAGMVEAMLARDAAAFDDIEGPLLYVHMLGLLAQERELREIDREVVARWKDRYLHIFNSTIGSDYPDYVVKRRVVITREFDALAARVREPTPGPAPKTRTRRAPK
jgi:hypothetical protein